MPQQDPFFRLENYEQCEIVETIDRFKEIISAKQTIIEDISVECETLESISPNWIPSIKRKEFSNVSFSKIQITNLDFDKCTFTDCLFHFSKIKNCRFHECEFKNCYMHKVAISETYLDPLSLIDATPKENRYANIGIHLFQVLMKNSRDEVQPSREASARFHFKYWERRILKWNCQEKFIQKMRKKDSNNASPQIG